MDALVAPGRRHRQPLFEEKGLPLGSSWSRTCRRSAATAHRLEQVVINLLSNAVQVHRRPDRVTCRDASRAPGDVVVAVTDTGLGIAPADQRETCSSGSSRSATR